MSTVFSLDAGALRRSLRPVLDLPAGEVQTVDDVHDLFYAPDVAVPQAVAEYVNEAGEATAGAGQPSGTVLFRRKGRLLIAGCVDAPDDTPMLTVATQNKGLVMGRYTRQFVRLAISGNYPEATLFQDESGIVVQPFQYSLAGREQLTQSGYDQIVHENGVSTKKTARKVSTERAWQEEGVARRCLEVTQSLLGMLLR